MSTAVMTTSSVFECSESLFKNTNSTKSKETANTSVVPISSVNNSNNATSGGHAPLRRSYTSFVTTLIEQHRKLDRSVSEPTSRYKTELCRPFEESGACKYGDKCQFAHGYTELRNLARHPKYKTELCRTFHSIGFCPYGPRCHFIHNFEEARIHNQKVSDEIGLPQPNILGLNPFLAAAAAAAAVSNNAGTTTTSNNNTNSNAATTAVTVVSGTVATHNNNIPTLNSTNFNVGLLKRIAVASSPQEVAVAAVTAAANNSSQNLIRTNSLNSAYSSANVFIPPLIRTNSLSLGSTQQQPQQQHHHQPQQQQQQQQQHNHHHHHHHHRQTCANVVRSSSIVGSTRPKPLNLSPTFSLGSSADSGSPPSSLSQSPTNSMASFFGDEQGNLTASNSLSTTAFSFGHNFGLIEPRQTPSPHTNLCSSSLSSDDIAPRTPSPLSPNAESRLPVFNRISSNLGDFENLKI
ncbi:PREDICTED: hybrid signal transduction histidine kinase L [Polistes dominula]|uniref:Hybrid signal transduction histidine kinase L n=1 Tax=Polistes dominula TaxID=743375 RepID=A0ABM1HUP1_POLDO|nr:PREDICTED: hybrid signal transduction histidine kinase L [Polistes dominula]